MTEESKKIKKKLYDIICEILEVEIIRSDLKGNENLIETYNIDSLIALQIIVKIEQKFNIIIEDDELAIELLESVDKAVSYIEMSV